MPLRARRDEGGSSRERPRRIDLLGQSVRQVSEPQHHRSMSERGLQFNASFQRGVADEDDLAGLDAADDGE
jgi:hypothetical protein